MYRHNCHLVSQNALFVSASDSNFFVLWKKLSSGPPPALYSLILYQGHTKRVLSHILSHAPMSSGWSCVWLFITSVVLTPFLSNLLLFTVLYFITTFKAGSSSSVYIGLNVKPGFSEKTENNNIE